MKNVIQNAISGLLLISVTALTASAAVPGSNEVKIQRAVEKSVLEQKTPLQKYREQLQALTPAANQGKPSQEELLPVLNELAAYNSQLSFLANWDETSYRLAQELNQPVKVYWNMYRGNSLIEIIDTYIPDNHGNKELAKLEFLVKKNLLSYKDWLENKALTDQLPDDFVFEQVRLEIALVAMSKREAKDIVKNLVGLANQYNKLYQNEQTRHVALQLHETYFRQPIRTGWDKTVTVDELRRQYGMETYTEPFSVESLQNKYGVSTEEAEALHAFLAHYHR